MSDQRDTRIDPVEGTPPRTPTWVKALGIAAIGVIVILVVVMLILGGDHGPGLHTGALAKG